MKLKRTLSIVGLLVLFLFLILTCIFFFYLGPVVKSVAERMGPKLLGTPLTIESLSINPRKGTVQMKGFAVANQSAFGRSNAVSLLNLDIDIDAGSVFSDTVTVHRITINKPHFVYEQNEASDNITEFIRHAKQGMRDKKVKEPRKKPTGDASGKAVLVEQLDINDLRFYVANTHDPSLDVVFGIKQLNVSMTNGLVRLDRFYISNPKRLDLPELFTLEQFEVKLKPKSILSAQPEIESLTIRRPHLYLEQNPSANTVGAFLTLTESVIGRLPKLPEKPPVAPAAAVAQTSAPSASSAAPVVLHDVLIEDIQVLLLNTVSSNRVSEPRMLAGIDAIEADLNKGTLHVGETVLPNVPGFTATNLFQLAGIDVELDPASLFQAPLTIHEVAIGPSEFHLEQSESSGNIHELVTMLQRFAPKPKTAEALLPASEQPEPAVESTTASGRKAIVLHHLQATNLAVYLRIPLTTNAMEGALSKLEEINPLGMESLKNLNPLNLGQNAKTNAPAATVDSGPLKLLAFDLLTIEPEKGDIRLSNLAVANLRAFSNPHLATIDAFKLTFDPETLEQETFLINEIAIEAPRISYELQLKTDNIRSLQAAIVLAVQRSKEINLEEEPEPEPEEKVSGAESGGQKVIIEHVVVRNGRVSPKISFLPQVPIPMPTIELNDIGKESGGASWTEAFSTIGGTLYEAILGTVVNTTGLAGDALKGAGSMTFGKLLDLTRRTKNEETEGAAAEAAVTEKKPETPSAPSPKEKSKVPDRSRPRHRGPRIRHFP